MSGSVHVGVGPRRWLRYAGLALAGMLAFVTAASVSSLIRDEGIDDAIVAPVQKGKQGMSPPKTPPPSNLALEKGLDVNLGAETDAHPYARLLGPIIHDPFTPLNTASPPASTAQSNGNVAPDPGLKARSAKPPEPVAPAPPPVAPPLPFVAVGSVEGAELTNGRPVAFIRQQDQLLVVHAGDTIKQTYRVDSITTQRIEFTYLPLMQRQTLALAP